MTTEKKLRPLSAFALSVARRLDASFLTDLPAQSWLRFYVEGGVEGDDGYVCSAFLNLFSNTENKAGISEAFEAARNEN